MKVLALTPYPEQDASTRYRIGQFRGWLAERGVDVTLAPMLAPAEFARMYRPGGFAQKSLDWLRAAGRRRAQLASARDYDAVFVHRTVWPLKAPALERGLLQRGGRFVFDFDDAVFLPNSSAANRALAFLRAPEKSDWLAAHARAVTAGNAFLARWAAGHASPGARVFEVPTAIDTARWSPRPSAREPGGIRLGWIGSHSTAPYLEALAPAIERVARRHPGLRLVIIGAESARFPGITELVPWREDTEVDALARVDIGLAPLPDSEWSKGKCGLKLLQSMALGKPVVASPVGVHPAMIEAGVQGFLPADEDAWVDALERLIADPELRRTMGERGRARVEERYSIAAVAPRLLEALHYAAEAA